MTGRFLQHVIFQKRLGSLLRVNKRRRVSLEAGFSLIEAVVASALFVMATTSALFILIATEHLSSQVLERSRLATLVENMMSDLKTSAQYDGATNTQLLTANLPQELVMSDNQSMIPCTLQRLAAPSSWILVNCTSPHGYHVQRIVHIPTAVPVPNAVVTALP